MNKIQYEYNYAIFLILYCFSIFNKKLYINIYRKTTITHQEKSIQKKQPFLNPNTYTLIAKEY